MMLFLSELTGEAFGKRVASLPIIINNISNIKFIAMKKSTTFKNKNLKMAAEIHLPGDFAETKKYPAIVCIHPAGGVKEQTIGMYASRLAKNGFAVLTFDASYQGASEGEPRYLEDPTARVEDARAGADYLSTLPYIDMDRLGVFGICAGGGYAISVAQTEHRFKAV